MVLIHERSKSMGDHFPGLDYLRVSGAAFAFFAFFAVKQSALRQVTLLPRQTKLPQPFTDLAQIVDVHAPIALSPGEQSTV